MADVKDSIELFLQRIGIVKLRLLPAEAWRVGASRLPSRPDLVSPSDKIDLPAEIERAPELEPARWGRPGGGFPD